MLKAFAPLNLFKQQCRGYDSLNDSDYLWRCTQAYLTSTLFGMAKTTTVMVIKIITTSTMRMREIMTIA
jgi:hypothetical protein